MHPGTHIAVSSLLAGLFYLIIWEKLSLSVNTGKRILYALCAFLLVYNSPIALAWQDLPRLWLANLTVGMFWLGIFMYTLLNYLQPPGRVRHAVYCLSDDVLGTPATPAIIAYVTGMQVALGFVGVLIAIQH